MSCIKRLIEDYILDGKYEELIEMGFTKEDIEFFKKTLGGNENERI